MPMYEYECPRCGHNSEALRSVSNREAGPFCRTCKEATQMRLVISVGPKPTDHLYPRLEHNFENTPVEIRSLKHFREEQKKRGLVDNGKPRGVRGQWV